MTKGMSTIVLIDDNHEWSQEMQIFLGEEGFSVQVADDGSVGLKLLESSDPILVILDVHLPRINGFDLLRQLRQQGRDVPVVMVSADDQAALMTQALIEGACAFLRKPVACELLLKAVLRYCSSEGEQNESSST